MFSTWDCQNSSIFLLGTIFNLTNNLLGNDNENLNLFNGFLRSDQDTNNIIILVLIEQLQKVKYSHKENLNWEYF